MADLPTLAASLTPGARRALLAMTGEWQDGRTPLAYDMRTMACVEQAPLIALSNCPRHRLTPLGQQLADHIRGEA